MFFNKNLSLGLISGLIFGLFFGWLYFISEDCTILDVNNFDQGLIEGGFTLERLSERGEERIILFKHQERGFSMEIPEYLQVARFDETGGAETVVFQKPRETHGFQIFILPYTEQTITEERIRADIPSGLVEEPMEVMIGKNKDIRAMAFLSENPIMGSTREVWFIRDGYLYEVTTYRPMDEWLAKVMDTLEFEKD